MLFLGFLALNEFRFNLSPLRVRCSFVFMSPFQFNLSPLRVHCQDVYLSPFQFYLSPFAFLHIKERARAEHKNNKEHIEHKSHPCG